MFALQSVEGVDHMIILWSPKKKPDRSFFVVYFTQQDMRYPCCMNHTENLNLVNAVTFGLFQQCFPVNFKPYFQCCFRSAAL